MFHSFTRPLFGLSKILFFLLAPFIFLGNLASAKSFYIVGSHAVFPFITAATERFSYETSYTAPPIEATGTGGGIKIFCSGIGAYYPDIVAASRPMSVQEKHFCHAHRVSSILELKIGYDGIALAKSAGSKTFPLTLDLLRQALSKTLNGKPNPHLYWSDISPTLPHEKIKIFGPPLTSGTRDAFEHLILKPFGADLREDGVYVEMPEQEALVAQKLRLDPQTIGIFSYSFLVKNPHLLTAFPVNEAWPTLKNILQKTYPLARPLFLYVKAYPEFPQSARAFIQSFMAPEASGSHGYLQSYGLIPLPKTEHTKEREKSLKFLNEHDK